MDFAHEFACGIGDTSAGYRGGMLPHAVKVDSGDGCTYGMTPIMIFFFLSCYLRNCRKIDAV